MPEIPDVVPGTPVASDWGNDVRDRIAQRYPDIPNRDASDPLPQEGAISYLENSNELQLYDGSAWHTIALTGSLINYLPLTGGQMLGGINLNGFTMEAASSIIGNASGAFGLQPGAGHPLELRDGNGIQRVFITETNWELRAVDTTAVFWWDETSQALQATKMNMGGSRIIVVGAPTADDDAATKLYVDDTVANAPYVTEAEGDARWVLLTNQFTQAMADALYLPIGTPLFTQADADLLYLPIGTPLAFLPLDGTGTMGGSLQMNNWLIQGVAPPGLGTDAVNKDYADTKLGDAPSDGSQYARQDAAWSVVTGGGGGIPEAPSDGNLYGRLDAAWWDVQTFYLLLSGGTMTGTLTVNAGTNLNGITTFAVGGAPPVVMQEWFGGMALRGGSQGFINFGGTDTNFPINIAGEGGGVSFNVETNHLSQNALGIHWAECNFLKIFTPVTTSLGANMHHQDSDGQVFHVNALMAAMQPGATVTALEARMSTPIVHTVTDIPNGISQDEIDFAGVLDEILTRLEALEP